MRQTSGTSAVFFLSSSLHKTIIVSTYLPIIVAASLKKQRTGEGGDPDALDIYYYMEGEKPLELPDIGREWPLDQPYAW